SSAAPPMALVGHQVDGQTPVLAVHGTVIDEVTGVAKDEFRVTVRNLSTGATLNTLSGGDIPEGRYSLTFVNTISSRATRVGDVLKITVQTRNPLIGVQPLRHIVSTDDVNGSQIRLPDLIAYEIPTETKLLANYPNPFNPETWIPFRLAKDSKVTLTIYDLTGKIVRSIEIGHTYAAVYESKDKAIYWDGRNGLGERIASGIYFYTLTARGSTKASSYTATRKMLILK
ncbi:T9SS type A sorting domain-containing protein, partial [Candidatus Poribacteria bacterium]|nr:T9SS type A sorting domain-containing protein [Candidatus Poribacteria bacterium]